jgi:hypothetical protein
MKSTTHTLQIALACTIAAAGAVLPFLDGQITPTKAAMGLVAIAAAINHVLGVQSEKQGDSK